MWPHGWSDGWIFSWSFRNSAGCAGDAFRRATEAALEAEYRAGQNAMVDDYRATYRTLTYVDLAWLRYTGNDPFRDAMKESFYKQLHAQQDNIPLDLLVAIKQCAEHDSCFLRWYRIAQISAGGSYQL